MKRLVVALTLLALPVTLFAQTSAIPEHISYQGHVTDSTGTPIGNNTTVNRTAIFRIYDAASGGARLWSEQQTITIASGDFSVLLGAGSAVTGETNQHAMGAALFEGKARYLGVTIADQSGNLGAEVSPRQQLVTTAFAFRSRVAESVVGQSVTGNMIANATITTAQVASNTLTSLNIKDGEIATADLANGAVTAAKLGSDVGVWSASGGNAYRSTGNVGIGHVNPQYALVVHRSADARVTFSTAQAGTGLHVGYHNALGAFINNYQATPLRISTNDQERLHITSSGNVGIGTASPSALLSLGTALNNTKLAFYDDGNSTRMGIGVQSDQLRIHTAQPTNRISFLNSPTGTEIVTFRGSGNVGIGTDNPLAKLHVNGGIAADGAHGYTFRYTGDDDSGMFSPADGTLVFRTNNIERLRIEGDGRMGFNTTNDMPRVTFLMKGKGSTKDDYSLYVLNSNGVVTHAFNGDGAAAKINGGSWTTTSDSRLKKNIVTLSGALEKMLKLRSVNFEFKEERYGKGRHMGFLAQEVQEVFPEWVSTGPEGYLAIATNGFESLTVQALRELRAEKDAQNAALAARVQELEAQNAALTQRVSDLTAQNSAAVTRLNSLEQRMNNFARVIGAAGNE